ncbi:uncharacterized protein LOC62_02G003442 [Vanrija pseudolonga]|uniref:GST N-terminal domain-containing protein n=1 Tax=Vanrija pseudolonga TaxID=143232 RepID=A0AAF0YAC6_9TREE|nr:hypothetical protein LOC62_02G003442 [Vanrija pseudolonga]
MVMKIYYYEAGAWSQALELAIAETGYDEDEVEWERVNLRSGANFDPKYLKLNPLGLIPICEVDGKIVRDSVNVAKEILQRAPGGAGELSAEHAKLIEQVHDASRDPKLFGLYPFDAADREEKASGEVFQFIKGRQTALEKYPAEAPELAEFYKGKLEDNTVLYDFYQGKLDAAGEDKVFAQGKAVWASAGELVHGPLTAALKTASPFLAGDKPGEADYHVIVWLARAISLSGTEQGQPADVGLPNLHKRIGGPEIDPAVAKYWETWRERESFTENEVW